MEPEWVRLFGFLESIRAVWQGRACLIEPGCAYLGVPFSFPVIENGPHLSSGDIVRARVLGALMEGAA